MPLVLVYSPVQTPQRKPLPVLLQGRVAAAQQQVLALPPPVAASHCSKPLLAHRY